MKRILITGAAGFIGFHLCYSFIKKGINVIGVDALFDLDDLWIKNIRLKILSRYKNFEFYKKELSKTFLRKINTKLDCIIHLAAISGIERFEENIEWAQKKTKNAALSIAEFANNIKIPVLYASSSSVYGKINSRKFSERINRLNPVSSYAKTKLMIEDIFKRIDTPTIGMRFFTVYGEYGRPDMSYFKFVEKINRDEPVIIYNKGIKRDFTYIKDLTKAISLISREKDKIFNNYGKGLILNIGTGHAVTIEKLVRLIGEYLNKKPVIKYGNAREYDLIYTCSDNTLLKSIIGYVPDTPIESGIKRFVDWYRDTLPLYA